CAMARIHRRRRLCDAVALAVRRLGDGRDGRLGGAGLLARRRRRVVRAYAGRAQAGRSRRAGCARELLRGGRLRALGRQAPADRGGMGGGRARKSSRRRLRHRVAVDAQRLLALSGLPRRGRRARRVQRQVHDQPNGLAWKLARDARRPCARELSQLLLSVGALAVQRAQALGLCGMNARANARRPELKMAAQIQAALRYEGAEAGSSFARDVIAGLTARPKRLSPKYFYDEIGAQLFEDITALPEYYLTRCELEILR